MEPYGVSCGGCGGGWTTFEEALLVHLDAIRYKIEELVEAVKQQ